MSRQRQRARAERESLAAQRRSADQTRRQRDLDQRLRRHRRQLAWRRLRLWRHGPAFRRDKEKWAALATIVLVCVLVTYLVTGSVHAVLLVTLVCLLASPALAALVFDRRSR